MKKFHDALEIVCGSKCYGVTAMLSADGSTLLTDIKKTSENWT